MSDDHPAVTSEDATPPGTTRDRKAEHIELALDPRSQLRPSAFDAWRLEHQALPEIDLADVDCATTFLGRELAMPLLVSCMTGGTPQAAQINRNLALGAEAAGVALGVGSQRKAIEDPSLAATFRVREVAPSVPLLANLGAVQLNYGFGVAECRQAVEMIGADALVLHLNPLQEALQPEGQGDFSRLAEKIGRVVDGLDVPVIVKEIGCGLSGGVARRLRAVGVTIFDCAGLGGTSWSRIEAWRAGDPELGERFAGWGIDTVESIRQLRAVGDLTIIGSGGVRSGIDAAKAIALGADLAGIAQPFLRAAVESADEVVARLARTRRELEIAMFCCGARRPAELRGVTVRREHVGGE
jgi:isopentenyl-diphosphate Delta-isomerase